MSYWRFSNYIAETDKWKNTIFLMEIYEFVISLKMPNMGKISMHILKFDEFCFTHDCTALGQCKNKKMVTVLILLWIH